jgi:class 3 adenylate cyclase/ActR/RegA family two-component response regulator
MITPAEIRAANVLIVDDNEDNVWLLEEILRSDGYSSVASTMDPREVCALHSKHRYDLILLDLQMPEMDGFQVMEGLKALDPDACLPVLVITAQPSHQLRALKAGARDFVKKPLDPPEVLMRVYNLLETSLLHKALTSYGKKLEIRNQLIRKTFGRYLSEDIVESLLASPEALELGGERRKVTMVMADLRGFTSMSESLPPERVVSIVNNYLEKMVETIVAHRGTIDEFTGDGIFAVFGAPITRPDDAERAVACAVAMQLAMVQVNDSNREMGLPMVEMGIGINTGEVVVGNIGSMQRAKYGVVGSAVNITSRIESYTTGGQIMISQSTLDAVRDFVDVEERMNVEAKGVSLTIPIYSVAGIRGRPDLALPRIECELSPPSAPLSVRFAVVHGKGPSGEVIEGKVTRLSRQNAEIEAPSGAPAFANLKLLFNIGGEEVIGNLYAKVSSGESPAGVFQVRFTSVPPEIESFLETLRPADRTAERVEQAAHM